jgi:hypothetical protein
LLAFQREVIQTATANGVAVNAIYEATNSRTQLFENDADLATLDGLEEIGESSQQMLLFVNEWLMTIADAVVGLFLWHLLEIEQLSAVGVSQLVTDIDYLR